MGWKATSLSLSVSLFLNITLFIFLNVSLPSFLNASLSLYQSLFVYLWNTHTRTFSLLLTQRTNSFALSSTNQQLTCFFGTLAHRTCPSTSTYTHTHTHTHAHKHTLAYSLTARTHTLAHTHASILNQSWANSFPHAHFFSSPTWTIFVSCRISHS